MQNLARSSVKWNINEWTSYYLVKIEQSLAHWVPRNAPAGLGEAMRYAVLDAGKRLRPLLTIAAAEAVGGNEEAALRAACAVELIHAYSLVHDDLPCMDNDVLRRGKPTVHIAFGEAQAMLVGDALQALAFEVITPEDASIPPNLQAHLCKILSRAAGYAGMAGGQAIDLASIGKTLSQDELREMHLAKTGALLQASVMMGAACGTASDKSLFKLKAYSVAIGLAFQVVDDILDVTADTVTLGKTAGKDVLNDKPTYVSILGLDRAREYASLLHKQALSALEQSGLSNMQALTALAEKLMNRIY